MEDTLAPFIPSIAEKEARFRKETKELLEKKMVYGDEKDAQLLAEKAVIK